MNGRYGAHSSHSFRLSERPEFAECGRSSLLGFCANDLQDEDASLDVYRVLAIQRLGVVMTLLRLATLMFIPLLLPQAAALAEQANPVMESYRAYVIALQHGDLAAAEAPAAAALAASQAQFGDGGRTPVLALNLARLRVALGRYREAREPAVLALRGAQAQGTTSGVDVVMAQIVLGRVEVATAEGSEHLRAALLAANGRADLDEDAYPAAIELGRAARSAEQYDVARLAYEAAVSHAPGAALNSALARGVARAAEGTVVILQASRHHMARSAMQDAYVLLTQAMGEIWPSAQQDNPDGTLTAAQTAFARAMAWRTLAAHSGGSDANIDPDVQNQIGVVACHYRVVRDETQPARRYYPPSAVAHDEEGIVVVRALFDPSGRMLRTQAAASAPNEAFSPAAEALISGMRLVREPNSAENCVMPHQRFFPVSFTLAD